MFTIQNLNCIRSHGHLSSHNFFVEVKKIGSAAFSIKVRLADLETLDLLTYSNMFYNYRIASVWSAPEVLKSMKKIKESTSQMDIYSFGLILWELWH